MAPLVDRSCHAVGFRAIWRIKDETKLKHAWDSLVRHRQSIDQVVQSVEGIAFYISSITGVFSKPSHKGEVPQEIYPAVAYWLALKNPDFDPYTLMNAISNIFNTETRLISNPTMPSVENFTTSLCAVLKDQMNGFVRQKIKESVSCCPDLAEQYFALVPSKLVLLDNSMFTFIENSLDRIQFSKFFIPVEVPEPTDM